MISIKTYNKKELIDFYADVDFSQFEHCQQRSGEIECWIGALSRKEAIKMLEALIYWLFLKAKSIQDEVYSKNFHKF